MKPVRAIVLAFLATTAMATALSALACAGSASATAICEVKPVEGKCSGAYEKGTALNGKASKVLLKTGAFEVECKESTLESKTTQEPTEKGPLEGTLGGLKFNSCSCATVEALHLSYKTSTEWTEASNAKTTLESGGSGSPAIKIVCSGVKCVYSAEKPSLAFSGGEPANFSANELKMPLVAGESSFLCKTGESVGRLTATYQLNQPPGGRAYGAAGPLPPTVMCFHPSNPCPGSEQYGSLPRTFETAVATPGVKLEWEGVVKTTCTVSAVKGTVSRYAAPLLGEVTEWTFPTCNNMCAVSSTRLPWAMKAEATPGGTGDGFAELASGGSGAPVIEVNCNGRMCNFAEPTVVFEFKGGTPAKFIFTNAPFAELGGGCGALKVTGTYEVETPSPVWLERGS